MRAALSSVPNDAAVHLEYASIGDRAFVRDVSHALLGAVDSFGCNEQELGDLYAALDGTQYAAEHFSDAPLDAVLAALTHVFASADAIRTAAAATGEPTRELTRIHFHYLRYHIIATSGERWLDTRTALGAGSWAATATACAFSGVSDLPQARPFDEHAVELDERTATALGLSASANVAAVRNGTLRTSSGREYQYVIAPVLVCKAPLRTVGLGDTVSATALSSTRMAPEVF